MTDELRLQLFVGDEQTRLAAIRKACPCHGSFEPLRELSDELLRLAREDPSRRIRQAAKHVLADGLVVNIHDDERERREEARLRRTALRRRRQEARQDRQRKRDFVRR